MKNATFLLIFLLGSTSLLAQSMKYTFNPGESINVEQTANIEVNQEIMEMKMNMTTMISNSMKMEIVSVEADVARIKSWYTNVAMDFIIDMGAGTPQKLHVDSNAAPMEEELRESHNLLKSMIAEPFLIHLRSNGTIVKIDGMEALESKMRSAVTDQAILDNLGKDFSPEKLRADFARFFVPYPGESLSKDSEWTSPISVPDLQLFDADQMWSVETIDTQANTIDLAADVKGIKLEKIENQVEMNLAGDMTTNYNVDVASGWSDTITMKSEMNGSAKMMQEGEEIKWPVTMRMNSIIRMNRN